MKRIREDNINTEKFWDAVYDRELGRGNLRIGRQIFKLVIESIDSKSSVLDVGCGTGTFIKFLHEHHIKKTYGIDISKKAIRYAKSFTRSSNFKVVDVNKGIRIKDNKFDIVTALETIEHVDDPEAVVADLIRIARKKVIITIPNNENIKSKDHIWAITSADALSWFDAKVWDANVTLFSNNKRIMIVAEKR